MAYTMYTYDINCSPTSEVKKPNTLLSIHHNQYQLHYTFSNTKIPSKISPIETLPSKMQKEYQPEKPATQTTDAVRDKVTR